MKRGYFVLLILVLLLSVTACENRTGTEQPEGTGAAQSAQPSADPATQQETPDSEPWFDFSDCEPVLDDEGDAEAYDVKRVYAANDDTYLYLAFEVADEGHIDSTTMIRGGEHCVFVGIDMPVACFAVSEQETLYADAQGNGKYAGMAAYQYEDGMLMIRVPLAIYDGETGFTINTLFRENVGGEKNDADTVDDFSYERSQA